MLYLAVGIDVSAGVEVGWGSPWFLTMMIFMKNMSQVCEDLPRVTQ